MTHVLNGFSSSRYDAVAQQRVRIDAGQLHHVSFCLLRSAEHKKHTSIAGSSSPAGRTGARKAVDVVRARRPVLARG